MYTIVQARGELEERVRRVVAQRYRAGRPLPQYFVAREVADGAPVRVDGFLVLGSRLVGEDELWIVTDDWPGRPLVRDERPRGSRRPVVGGVNAA